MEDVRNGDGKLICKADPLLHSVEIIHKGRKTIIRFTANGAVEVINV